MCDDVYLYINIHIQYINKTIFKCCYVKNTLINSNNTKNQNDSHSHF